MPNTRMCITVRESARRETGRDIDPTVRNGHLMLTGASRSAISLSMSSVEHPDLGNVAQEPVIYTLAVDTVAMTWASCWSVYYVESTSLHSKRDRSRYNPRCRINNSVCCSVDRDNH